MPRVVIDRYAYEERYSIIMESSDDVTEAAQVASADAYNTPFARTATAMANGDDAPAKALCRAEMSKHGKQHALDLWDAIQEAVRDSPT